jgi:hypothetical protein
MPRHKLLFVSFASFLTFLVLGLVFVLVLLFALS